MLARHGFPERGPLAQAGQPQGLAADLAPRLPRPGLCLPPLLPPGAHRPSVSSSPSDYCHISTESQAAQEWFLPSGARSEDVTGLAICLPNRQGVGAGRGSPQPEQCPPLPGGLPTFPCSCQAVLSGVRGPSWPPPAPWVEEARVQRERQGQQRGGRLTPPTSHLGQLPGPEPPSTSVL